jgi:RNA polymerase sigma factor (sigma-70 family)
VDSERHTAMIEAARSGDRRAQDELVAAYLPLVYNVVGRALNGHADVDDVVQETMIRALGGLAALRDPNSFRSWLVAIAMNQIRGRWQAQHAVPAVGDLGDAHDVADPGADFVDLTIVRMGLTGQRREVAEATRWLDADDRELLSLWWLEATGELTRAEVAAAMELSHPHTAVRVQRMKAQLETARMVVRALSVVPRCVLLEDVLRAWDGVPSALWRKRLARHARACTVCSRLGDELVPAEGLLVGLGLLPVGAALADLTAGEWSGSVALAAYGDGAPVGSVADARDAAAPGAEVLGARGEVAVLPGPARREIRRERRVRRRRAGVIVVVALLVGGGAVGGMTVLSPDEEAGAVRAQATPEPNSAERSRSVPSASASASPSAPAAPTPSDSPSGKATASPRPTPGKASTRPAPPQPSRTTKAAASASVARQVTDLVNTERAKSGCDPVRHNDVLGTAALRHSADMDARDYFDHTDPDGAGPGERITAAGYEWSTYGENIARGQQTPDQVMNSWMDSPGHRANILNCAFKEMGVGLHEDAEGPWWTQVFATAG